MASKIVSNNEVNAQSSEMGNFLWIKVFLISFKFEEIAEFDSLETKINQI